MPNGGLWPTSVFQVSPPRRFLKCRGNGGNTRWKRRADTRVALTSIARNYLISHTNSAVISITYESQNAPALLGRNGPRWRLQVAMPPALAAAASGAATRMTPKLIESVPFWNLPMQPSYVREVADRLQIDARTSPMSHGRTARRTREAAFECGSRC